MKKLGLFLLCILSISAFSQKASIAIDNNQLRIGEQTQLRISFEYQNPSGNALILWPEYGNELTSDIEIIDKTIDLDRLVDSASATYKREQKLIITAFEEGSFTIPSQEVQMGDSTYSSNELELLVETVAVDTSKGIVDIKPIYSVDYPFSERAKDWVSSNWLLITILFAIILIYFIYRYLKQRRTNEKEEEVLEEIIPAHIIALETLEKLLKREEWKSAQKKLYYSELTDTVRTYLENRFNIHAMEQTTREIIRDLKHAAISEEDKVYLRKILREADMVKFAKFTPSNDQAYAYLNTSIDFVKRTRQKEIETNGN